jgi:hypothetical protein
MHAKDGAGRPWPLMLIRNQSQTQSQNQSQNQSQPSHILTLNQTATTAGRSLTPVHTAAFVLSVMLLTQALLQLAKLCTADGADGVAESENDMNHSGHRDTPSCYKTVAFVVYAYIMCTHVDRMSPNDAVLVCLLNASGVLYLWAPAVQRVCVLVRMLVRSGSER